MSIRCRRCKYWADLPAGKGYSDHGEKQVKECGRCVSRDYVAQMRALYAHKIRPNGKLPEQYYKTSYGDYCCFGEEAPA